MVIQNQELINQVANILGNASEAAISEYVTWHITAALTWLIASGVALVLLFRWDTTKTKWEFPPKFIKITCICLISLIVCSYVPDLVSPKAVSIHQLLRDLN